MFSFTILFIIILYNLANIMLYNSIFVLYYVILHYTILYYIKLDCIVEY